MERPANKRAVTAKACWCLQMAVSFINGAVVLINETVSFINE